MKLLDINGLSTLVNLLKKESASPEHMMLQNMSSQYASAVYAAYNANRQYTNVGSHSPIVQQSINNGDGVFEMDGEWFFGVRVKFGSMFRLTQRWQSFLSNSSNLDKLKAKM